MLYFDHNATTPVCETAIEAWVKATRELVGNPSSLHRLGSRAERALDSAREELAGYLGCRPHEIVWTSGATESCNMVLNHFAKVCPGEAEVWISAIEHPCVIESARVHFADRVKLIPVNSDGLVDTVWLERALKGTPPCLIAVMAANNETGVIQPWNGIRELCAEHRVPFFCDAAQWAGKLPLGGLGACDFVSGCAHKFGGPKGAGFLKVPDGLPFRALIHGGPQEERRRAGTENVAGVVSMMAALHQRESGFSTAGIEKAPAMRNDFEDRLCKALPGASVIGRNSPRLWNTSLAIMPSADCRARWVVKLDKLGVAVSTGSACSSGKETTSHVLSAMGFGDDEAARVLRFSSGWETSADDWGRLLSAIGKVSESLLSVGS